VQGNVDKNCGFEFSVLLGYCAASLGCWSSVDVRLLEVVPSCSPETSVTDHPVPWRHITEE
jgi:hypothetical protein